MFRLLEAIFRLGVKARARVCTHTHMCVYIYIYIYILQRRELDEISFPLKC
jgi:hypothetical protein